MKTMLLSLLFLVLCNRAFYFGGSAHFLLIAEHPNGISAVAASKVSLLAVIEKLPGVDLQIRYYR